MPVHEINVHFPKRTRAHVPITNGNTIIPVDALDPKVVSLGTPGAIPGNREDFGVAVRRKLVMEVSGIEPKSVVRHIADKPSKSDCLAGEKQWQDMFDR